jgi:regulator of RNase E activity RraA
MPITIRPLPPQIPQEKLARLLECETATIGHFEHETFMAPEIRALMPGVRVAGTAITVRIPQIDTAMQSYCLSFARPGDFIIMDRCGDHKHAAWGGVASAAAKIAGVVGIAIDGSSCDIEEQVEMGIPAWCRGLSPITGKRSGQQGSFNVPVSCGGVTVNPGDAVLADSSGVFVCSPERLDAVIEEALRRQKSGETTLARLRAGEKIGNISGLVGQIHERLRKEGTPSPFDTAST